MQHQPPLLVAFFEATADYVAHFELMVQTSKGYQPVMSSHPLSGDRPLMFSTSQEAENFSSDHDLESLHSMVAQPYHGMHIVFFPSEDVRRPSYTQHFECFKRHLFQWKPIQTFHPMTGDRPLMFDHWSQAKNHILSLESPSPSSRRPSFK